jgi:hypothetical protein
VQQDVIIREFSNGSALEEIINESAVLHFLSLSLIMIIEELPERKVAAPV